MIRHVYMIDDSGLKFSWLEPIVEACTRILQERGSPIEVAAPQLGDCVTRPPLTVEDHARLALKSITAAETWKILQDEAGIYMLDLKIPVQRDSEHYRIVSPLQFLSIFNTYDSPALERARALAQLPQMGPEDRSRLENDDYKLAVAVASYLRATGKPFWLITSEAPVADQERFRRAFDLPRRESFDDITFRGTPEQLKRAAEHALTLISLFDPLQTVQAATAQWFSEEKRERHDYATEGLPHGWHADRADDHKACVKKLWPWAPDIWWSEANGSDFHECLKNSVGKHSGWMGHDPDRPLTLAGCYFLFLMAVEQRAPDAIADFLIEDWTVFCQGGQPAPFLNPQERHLAEATVRALFDFFLEIVSHRDDQDRLGIDGWAPPTHERRCFGVHLNWDDAGRGRFATKVNERLGRLAQCGAVELHASKATAHFLRFMLLKQGTKQGAGSPSGIWFADDPNGLDQDRGWLWIGREG